MTDTDGKIIDITAGEPHIRGEQICLACRHRQGPVVAPEGVTHFQCEECGTNRAVWIDHIVDFDKPLYNCNTCESHAFTIALDDDATISAVCMGCGKAHFPWED